MSQSNDIDHGPVIQTAEVRQRPNPAARRPRAPAPKMLPPWKVLLHNDDKNELDMSLLRSVRYGIEPARTRPAHDRGA